MILIDNYDSFTYNIVQYLRELGVEPVIFENDKITIEELSRLNFDRIIISPGAGTPDNAGISTGVIEAFYKAKKILGVCLGHQCIAQFFGAKVVRAAEPVHGKTSRIFFDEKCRLFCGIPQGFEAVRYHSLAAEGIGGDLIPVAQTKDWVNMAIMHKKYPVYGVQFHPEGILTEYGKVLLANFCKI
ncbi:MAG: aminodeoxychorismate/anthranilate synthase component II [Heliobacteriaceae bacterium]|jgi:anthranilate synthase/aminodeoxychorismate synthase-like glutamine amidotransferase|nr:aminodeoxychorismate/anthranilate synthase component II [Heliobacteriaceae bacterium]